jgi:hypothetical protein
MPTYRVTDKTTGLEWIVDGKTRRVESGDSASDFPADSIPDLLAQGLIEEAGPGVPVDDDLDTQPLDGE